MSRGAVGPSYTERMQSTDAGSAPGARSASGAPAPRPAIFTLDLEDRRVSPDQEPRVERMADLVLAHLATIAVRGTFFVVGSLAEAEPALIKKIHAAGHEIALHGWTHTRLSALTPEEFRSVTARGAAVLEDATGEACLGYRAPNFSLIRGTEWAADIMSELGFTYSSSVLPAPNPIAGYPGAPREPFLWPSGLLELPCPVFGPRKLSWPALGGTYLRLAPGLVGGAALRHSGGRLPWLYSHPYDFDVDEPFFVFDDTSYVTSRLLFVRRSSMLSKVTRLCAPAGRPSTTTMAEAAEACRPTATAFAP